MPRVHLPAVRESDPDIDDDGEVPELDGPRIVMRPDGYHWLSEDGRIENGPFESARAAWADMHAADEDAPEPGESVIEASSEIGIADWVDPDTGEPAEGTVPRLGDN